MKRFIEVNASDFNGEYDLKSINIDSIIDFDDRYITTTAIDMDQYSNGHYSEKIRVKESYEEIKELIKKAQQITETGILTKREYIATQIAIGLSVQAIPGNHNIAENMSKEVPRTAVMIADALIKELEKSSS